MNHKQLQQFRSKNVFWSTSGGLYKEVTLSLPSISFTLAKLPSRKLISHIFKWEILAQEINEPNLRLKLNLAFFSFFQLDPLKSTLLVYLLSVLLFTFFLSVLSLTFCFECVVTHLWRWVYYHSLLCFFSVLLLFIIDRLDNLFYQVLRE
jgi:hypothetical protein